jgi:hypothetical protein
MTIDHIKTSVAASLRRRHRWANRVAADDLDVVATVNGGMIVYLRYSLAPNRHYHQEVREGATNGFAFVGDYHNHDE